MDQPIFLQLSLTLAVAAGVSIIMRLLRQPLIIGYIISGILCGPTALGLIHDHTAFEAFSEIGIALLLFIVGLGLNISVIKDTGKPVFLVFITNLLLVGGIAFGVSRIDGFSVQDAVLIGLGLVFSSTIVVIKSLNDKREQHRLYGQITVGVLLVEDLLATAALLYVSTAGQSGTSLSDIAVLVLKGAGLAAGLAIAARFILPRLSRFSAGSQEFLYTFALAWAFGIASLSKLLGFSIEIGALFAGVALASLPYAGEISNRLKPLRDFFLVLFFITLGERLDLGALGDVWLISVILAAVAVLLKPLAVMASMGLLGYTKRTSFKTAGHLSQISEFSIILVSLAVASGIASDKLVGIMTLTALITIALSSYVMKYDDSLLRILSRPLSLFERANPAIEGHDKSGYKLVLFGYHKGGYEFVKTFRDMRRSYLVVDYDPDAIEAMERRHIHHVYGDATDLELLEEIGVRKSELVVSTISDYQTNVLLSKFVTGHNPNAIFICHADDYDDAAKLYDHGASYVMLPHFIGNEKMNAFIRRNGSSRQAFERYRKNHLQAIGKFAVK